MSDQFGSQAGRCSANLIGPSTAITAAHCIHDGLSGYLSIRGWAPAADGHDNQVFTFDPTPAPNDAYPHSPAEGSNPKGIVGCASMTQFGFDDDDELGETDYAVIEFDEGWWNPFNNANPGNCSEGTGLNDHPGDTLGWIGVTVNVEESTLDNNDMHVNGYPGINFQCPNGDCKWPTIWGSSSFTTDTARDGRNIDHFTDVSEGMSGSALYWIDQGGARRAIGINTQAGVNIFEQRVIGENCDWWGNCEPVYGNFTIGKKNRARMINSVAWSNIRAASEL